MLKDLVCPSEAVISWVSSSMRKEYEESILQHEKLVASIQAQIDRVSRMDEDLYDDKLSGDISKERYNVKHEQFVEQKLSYETKLANSSRASGIRLEQKLVLLELSQKAAELYPRKSPEQKRIIVTNLFSSMTANNGSVSVKYTRFALAVAEKVRETRQLIGV